MFMLWLSLVVFATILAFTMVAVESCKRIGWPLTVLWYSPIVWVTLWNAYHLYKVWAVHG